MPLIKFEPPLTCSTIDCGNQATVGMVEPAPPQLGEFVEFPPVGPTYIFMPICEDCVTKLGEIYLTR